MRINERFKQPNGKLLFDCVEIKYAVLGCLAFTNKKDKLREMLLYVLLCSKLLGDKLDKRISMFDIIDDMTVIIGQDYKNCGKHVPAEILCSLDKDSRRILFRYMNNRQCELTESELHMAQQNLKEKLVSSFGDVKEMRVFEPVVYLSLLNDYLTLKLNEISMQIAREIYKCLSEQ